MAYLDCISYLYLTSLISSFGFLLCLIGLKVCESLPDALFWAIDMWFLMFIFGLELLFRRCLFFCIYLDYSSLLFYLMSYYCSFDVILFTLSRSVCWLLWAAKSSYFFFSCSRFKSRFYSMRSAILSALKRAVWPRLILSFLAHSFIGAKLSISLTEGLSSYLRLMQSI